MVSSATWLGFAAQATGRPAVVASAAARAPTTTRYSKGPANARPSGPAGRPNSMGSVCGPAAATAARFVGADMYPTHFWPAGAGSTDWRAFA